MIVSIITMSISVIFPIIVIVFLRNCVVYGVPKKILKFFWIIMICRLLIPVSVPLDFLGSFNINRSISRVIFSDYLIGTSESVNRSIEKKINNYELNVINQGGEDSPNGNEEVKFVQKQYGLEESKALTFIWIFGFLLVTFFILFRHLLFIRKCKAAIVFRVDYKGIEGISEYLNQIKMKRKVRIKQFDDVAVPFTYGIIRPVIIIPKAFIYDEKLLKFSLLHELTHVKKLDVFIKLLLAISVCIHWFNPFVWLMYFFVDRDIELACDEEVSKFLGKNLSKDYAISLLDVAALNKREGFLVSSYANFFLEERCVSIMKSKKSVFFTSILLLGGITLSAQAFASASMSFNEKLELEKEDKRLNSLYNLGDLEEQNYDEMLVQIDEETMERKVSFDRGESWLEGTDADILLSQDEANRDYWTADEFELWLQSFLENNDELYEEGKISKEEKEYNIQFYSEMLEEIKNGALYTNDNEFEEMEFNLNDYLQGKDDLQGKDE